MRAPRRREVSAAVDVTDLESATASMVTVDRALGDLRRGDFVVLEGAGAAR